MMQRYSYELVSNLVKEFSRGTVVTLNIEQQGSDFVVDYTYLRDYKENEQALYNKNISLDRKHRYSAMSSLEKFNSAMEQNAVAYFSLSFNAMSFPLHFNCSYSYTGKYVDPSLQPKPEPKKEKVVITNDFIKEVLLEKFSDDIDEETDFFVKGKSGKQTRYTPVKVGELIDFLTK